jgi:hypothetical protein
MADPLDWLRSNMPSFTPEAKELAKARLEDCKACNAKCPLGKWGEAE